MINYKNLEELYTAGSYLVKLLSAVLHEEEAPPLPESLNWKLIYDMAKMHSVETMAFYGAEPFIRDDAELYQNWKKSRDANIAQSLHQIEARKEVFQALYEAGIRFLPLKGYEMKCLYPRPEFRQMADVDVLIDPENTSRAREIMIHLGYRQKEALPHHDEYFRPPFVTVEVHRQMLLVGESRQAYYDNIWDRALIDEENPGGYKLSPEDFYIYQIAHFEKHYSLMGSGIRSALDIYVYLNKFRTILNRDYIKEEFQKLNIYNFGTKMEYLSQFWFSKQQPDIKISKDELNEIQKNIFLSGVYGSLEFSRFKKMSNLHIEKGFKQTFHYFWTRIFTRKKDFKNSYPFLRKYPFLLPFCWFHRLIYVLLHKKQSIKRELELYKKVKEK